MTTDVSASSETSNAMDPIRSVMRRFNDDYFIQSLGKKHGYFCIPNFVFRLEDEKLVIQLLAHVSEADEQAIRARLAGLAYEVAPERLTLEAIEQQTGVEFPDVTEE